MVLVCKVLKALWTHNLLIVSFSWLKMDLYDEWCVFCCSCIWFCSVLGFKCDTCIAVYAHGLALFGVHERCVNCWRITRLCCVWGSLYILMCRYKIELRVWTPVLHCRFVHISYVLTINYNWTCKRKMTKEQNPCNAS